MRYKLILLALFAVFGVFLLRGGITGSVISESCCYGLECTPENMCPTTGASLESPASMGADDYSALSFVGFLIVAISIALVFGCLIRKTRQMKREILNKE